MMILGGVYVAENRRFHPFCEKIICKTYLIWAHSQYAMQLRQDTGLIYGFILKMARYEKLESEVDTSEEALRPGFVRRTAG